MQPSPNPAPIELGIRMYQVGFGDCFLLTFRYEQPLADSRNVRHVLIDFGSTRTPWRRKDLVPIADSIHEHTGGELDVVVVTHRHKDHLSGFRPTEATRLGMKPGFPRLVVRSWTEHPKLDRDATGPAAAAAVAAAGPMSPDVRRQSARFATSLRDAERFATSLQLRLKGAAPNSLSAELRQLADDQISNKPAIDQLRRWGEAGKAAYLNYGMSSGIEEVVPGIGVRVLGPPTVNQYPDVASQRASDPSEFWMIYQGVLGKLRNQDLTLKDFEPDLPIAGAGDSAADPDDAVTGALSGTGSDGIAADEAPTTRRVSGEPPPGPVRWLTDRLGRQQVNSILRIVRILDDVLNNTSVILLWDVPVRQGTLRLLFGGDAQIENWEYALKHAPDHAANLDLLREVDVYKVGHHGSRNATPRTLFNLWQEAGTVNRKMIALMSTKPGVHGKSEATKVPRKTLVAALDTRMTTANFYKTTDLATNVWYVELKADLTAGKDFTVLTPPPAP